MVSPNKPRTPTTVERIHRFADNMKPGTSMSASQIAKAIGGRGICSTQIGAVLRDDENVVWEPSQDSKKPHRGKWRRV